MCMLGFVVEKLNHLAEGQDSDYPPWASLSYLMPNSVQYLYQLVKSTWPTLCKTTNIKWMKLTFLKKEIIFWLRSGLKKKSKKKKNIG